MKWSLTLTIMIQRSDTYNTSVNEYFGIGHSLSLVIYCQAMVARVITIPGGIFKYEVKSQ